GQVPQPARENLKNAEMTQRQVGNRVTSKPDGLDQKVGRFLDDLKNFKINNPDARKQMESIKGAVGRIRENHLDPAEQGLPHASKNPEEPQAGAAAPSPSDNANAPADQAKAGGAQNRADTAQAKAGGATKADSAEAKAGGAEKADAAQAKAG